MVNALPRKLDDDYAFNVHIKKHQIHKSFAYSSFDKKSTVKAWLSFLIDTPLYKERGITIDDAPSLDYATHDVRANAALNDDQDNEEPIIETIDNNAHKVNSILLSKQHTMLWNEKKYLSLKPDMNQPVVALGYDEHAEELSFPSIYLGEAKRFHRNVYDATNDDDENDMLMEVSNTVYAMASSEIRRTDRRGVKSEHILYMAMKVMRLILSDGMRQVFKVTGDTNRLTRENLENKELMESMIE
ncbi:Serine--tRNA ligase [Aphis craccivora]|uniref:Serine--tRNA ligase n=1 Tax=Aphis craccivora TaxID=307492 RepID=A0A6G0X094_APHCR|nr:Serine--tRNA ligase [Aphis craccivora]